MREVGEALRRAGSTDEVWEGVKQAAQALGASCAALTLVERRDGESAATVRSVGFDQAGSQPFRARYSLLGERPDDGAIELGWRDGRGQIDRDTEIAVEILCEHVQAASARLAQAGGEPSPGARVVALRRGSSR